MKTITHMRCTYCGGWDCETTKGKSDKVKEEWVSYVKVITHDRTVDICERCFIKVFDMLLSKPPDLTNQMPGFQYGGILEKPITVQPELVG